MNYEPIFICTQSNGFTGTKESNNAGQARKETEHVKDYILLPLWTVDPPFSQDSTSSQDIGFKPSNDDRKKVDEDPRQKSKCKDQEKENNVNNTNNVNNVSSTVNAAGTNGVNVVGELLFDLDMSALEDISTFNFSNKDENDNAMNNLDTTIQVIPTPTIRIHKDHPLDQKFRFTEVKNVSTPMETQKPLLKDEDGKEVDVHMYSARNRQWLQFPQQKLNMWLLQVAVDKCFGFRTNYLIMEKAKKSVRLMMDKLFEIELELILLVNVNAVEDTLRYALTVNPTIYDSCIEHFWSIAMAKMINGEAQIYAWVDGKEIIITESSIRRDLRLEDKEGVDCLPNSTIFENLELMGKPKRKNTQVPQPSGSIKHVSDEVVYKELDDILVRAATTASSLEAEQDSGNVDKTQSKETPNKAGSPGTTSSGGPKRQKAIGDTIAQTRRVKKLEKKQRSRTYKLKRLYKVGLIARVDSSKDGQSLGKDASKQGRKIDDIDVNEDITLVNDQDDVEIFDVNDLHGEEMFVQKEFADKEINDEVSVVGEVNAARIATTISVAATITTKEITWAQALVEIKTAKPKAKGIVLQEPTKLQEEFYEEQRLARERAQKEQEANIALIETWDDIQAKIDADYQMAERLEAKEQQELNNEEKATLFM
nr:hypothetical protein [Tanacetum cinerariifolium]